MDQARERLRREVREKLRGGDGPSLFENFKVQVPPWDYDTIREFGEELVQAANQGDSNRSSVIAALTYFLDRRVDPGEKRRSCLLEIVQECLEKVFSSVPGLDSTLGGTYRKIDRVSRKSLRKPEGGEKTLILDAAQFPPEGDDGAARILTDAYHLGWRQFIVYGCRGQRFIGCGLGPGTQGVRLDVYGSSGDYLGSGMDGMEMHVHGNAQDQLGQVLKSGKLVIHGDVGQTFMYGAKGGSVYVLGNAAGRPLINAVGKPRVVINGTALDYLAESFMAGDPHNGGGFVVLNGMEFDEKGGLREQPMPFPGSNLFSLASGGALYVRDPHGRLEKEQLNGGEFSLLEEKDWKLILPHLQENERLFGIDLEGDLMTVDGERKSPQEVYRKVRAVKLSVLSATTPEDEV
jgi:glutamate synthase domain-containing protein 3